MSKWINVDKFKMFQEQKIEEKDNTQKIGDFTRLPIWRPEKGTADNPKTYIGRFLPDKKSNFYVKYFYHMFKIGDSWAFFKCSKTEDFKNFCPFCSVASKLYQGTQAEKKMAYNFKRKTKFAANFYIIEDPRDVDKDEENKVSKTVRLYEFPEKVEKLIKEEIIDRSEGRGYTIFDPGKNGYNFILKVYATKKDENNQVWPDYSSSKFSRTSDALGNEKEIDEIMNQTIDLEDYLKSFDKDDVVIKKALKDSMVWELVEDEWITYKGADLTDTKKESKEKEEDIPEGFDESYHEDNKEKNSGTEDDDSEFSEEDLLKELEDL
jgi:hypothetical protein